MSEKDKAVAQRLAEAFESLPESKKEYLLGYADGVAGAKASGAEEQEEKQ